MPRFERLRFFILSLWERAERRVEQAQVYIRANQAYLLAQARLWVGRGVFWLAGIAVGLAAVGFALLTDEAAHFFLKAVAEYPWLPFILTPAAGAGLLWITRNYFRGAEGSGIPQVMAELKRPADIAWRPLVSLRIAVGKVLIGVAAVGSGFSFGREGPTVQIGAALMSYVGRLLPTTLRIQQHHLLVAGGAAGIAAAFNAPLAGIVFAIEELSRSVESRMSGVVITAIVLAGVVAQAFLGDHNYFGYVTILGETRDLLQTILLCAVVSGIAGGTFARMLVLAATGWTGRVAEFRTRRPYLFAALIGLLVASLGWATGGLTWGSGYAETRALLEQYESVPWYFGPAKFIATVAAYLTGLPGGIFAPSLAIGAGIGRDLVPLLDGQAIPPTVIVLCMVGFLAAATQAPITSFIIVMEMVNGYSLVMDLMATALIASAISRLISRPLYSTLAENMIRQQQPKAESGRDETASRPS
ncbi:MAG: chloride channel protein [Azonexus sp.]|nr:chloride channel protein [Azonexus sp.]MDZ4314070.1 chloride channel protein [Azonexus sp.]